MSTPPVKILNTKIAYEGFNTLKVYDFQAPSLIDGQDYTDPMNREVLHTSNGAVVLIYIKKNDSFLICEQFRTGVFFNEMSNDKPFTLEAPAGLIEYGFTPEETARKEVLEETGITLDHLTFIQSTYSNIGTMTQKSYIYFSTLDHVPENGIFGNAHEEEEVKTHLISRAKVFEMLDAHQLVHSETVTALYWFKTQHLDLFKGDTI